MLLRVDCEHPEAERWAGDASLEARALPPLLALLRVAGVSATLAFVGRTAERHPELVRAAVEAGHAIAGHSHTHARAYAGQGLDWQITDLRAMRAAIAQAGGGNVRGLAPPCHGAVDAATLQAAGVAGLDYVLRLPAETEAGDGHVAGSPAPAPSTARGSQGPTGTSFVPVDGPRSLLVPPAQMGWIWDWTPLQPGWPAFSAARATAEWQAAVDRAATGGALLGFILHPWIMASNAPQGEADAVAALLSYARTKGARVETFDALATAARGARPASSTTNTRPGIANGRANARNGRGTPHERREGARGATA